MLKKNELYLKEKLKKIFIILPDLCGGGAERLHVYLANEWLFRGYYVEFILMKNKGDLISLLCPDIKIKDFNVLQIRSLIYPLSKYIKKNKPDIIITAMWPLTSAVVIAWCISGKKGNLYLSDHENLSASYLSQHRVKPSFLKILIKTTYPYATGIIAVSNGVKEDICFLGSLLPSKVKVIYNPAAIGVSESFVTHSDMFSMWGNNCKYKILSVGRLSVQKDHKTLIKAFSLLPPEINAKLIILGDGPLRGELEKLIQQMNLTERITLPGFVLNPTPFYQSADLFVLSSLWEGFGNVIVEALECGLRIVSTDCPSGPSEILADGLYGKLVPVSDSVKMSNAIVEKLRNTHNSEFVIKRAQDFSLKKISDDYLAYMSL